MTDPTPRTAATAREALESSFTSALYGFLGKTGMDGKWVPLIVAEAMSRPGIQRLLAAAEAPGRVAALEAVAKRAASMGGCSQAHHDYVIAAARAALAAPAPTPSEPEDQQ